MILLSVLLAPFMATHTAVYASSNSTRFSSRVPALKTSKAMREHSPRLTKWRAPLATAHDSIELSSFLEDLQATTGTSSGSSVRVKAMLTLLSIDPE